jgi:hypothetical protein
MTIILKKASLITIAFSLCTLKCAEAKSSGHTFFLPSPAVTIPIVIVHNIPVIQLTVNGVKNELFMLDSGAQKTVLNADDADEMNISRMDRSRMTLQAIGNGLGQPVLAARSVKIKFKGDLLIKGDFPATSLSTSGNELGIKLAGIIGYDLLRAHPTVIDLKHKRLMIYQTKAFANIRNIFPQTYDVDKDGPLPVISAVVGVEGQVLGAARVLIDTGSDRTLGIRGYFASEHQLIELPGWKKAEVLGANGKSEVLNGLTGWIKIGPTVIQIEDVLMILPGGDITQVGLDDAYLGVPMFNGGLVIFDVGDGYVSFGDFSNVIQ